VSFDPKTSTLQGPVIVIIINIRFGRELELPLLVNTGYVDPTSVNANPNAVSVDTNASGLESPSLVGHGIANPEVKPNKVVSDNNDKGAGSGIIVPSPSSDGNSNPRVLSDMGLAIPRPTRLGDPRSEPDSEFNSVSVCASSSNIILTSLHCCPFLRAALQPFAVALLLAAMVPTM
jgi:hypothetical protein